MRVRFESYPQRPSETADYAHFANETGMGEGGIAPPADLVADYYQAIG